MEKRVVLAGKMGRGWGVVMFEAPKTADEDIVSLGFVPLIEAQTSDLTNFLQLDSSPEVVRFNWLPMAGNPKKGVKRA